MKEALFLSRAPSARVDGRAMLRRPEEIKVRHVQLFCGDRVFSEADNGEVPSQSSPEMNRLPEGWETKPLAEARLRLAFHQTRANC